jgi:putative sigma-54 modulation protein
MVDECSEISNNHSKQFEFYWRNTWPTMILSFTHSRRQIMQLDIQTQGFDLTYAISGYIDRRLASGLGRSAHHVSRVAVLLADINGPRGGIDKRCRIRVRLDPSVEVVVEDTQSDLYTAIDRAAKRVGRSVARKLGRQRRTRFLTRALRDSTLQPAVTS